MAAKWNNETISSWEEKGEDACGNLIKKAGLALKKAEDRQADEARLRKMEASRDKLATLTLVETVQDESKERDQEQLIDPGEEVVYNKGNVMSMAQMLKRTGDADIANNRHTVAGHKIIKALKR